MSRVLFDFLNDSLLLDPESLKRQYEGIPEARLRKELVRYREHVVARHAEIVDEVRQGTDGPNAYVGAATGHAVDRIVLKRMALYFSRTVIDDPLMPFTRAGGEPSDTIAQFFGYEAAGPIDRAKLAQAAGFLSAVRPFVGIDCLKIATC